MSGAVKQISLNFLYVGRFTKEKNVSFLIDVLAALFQKDISFSATFIGYGAEQEALEEYTYVHYRLPIETIQFIEKPDKDLIPHAFIKNQIFFFLLPGVIRKRLFWLKPWQEERLLLPSGLRAGRYYKTGRKWIYCAYT